MTGAHAKAVSSHPGGSYPVRASGAFLQSISFRVRLIEYTGADAPLASDSKARCADQYDLCSEISYRTLNNLETTVSNKRSGKEDFHLTKTKAENFSAGDAHNRP